MFFTELDSDDDAEVKILYMNSMVTSRLARLARLSLCCVAREEGPAPASGGLEDAGGGS